MDTNVTCASKAALESLREREREKRERERASVSENERVSGREWEGVVS
jgi:hypothetical protein